MAAIDNPPAQPDQSDYQLSALDIYPNVTLQPAGTTADVTQPAKTWSRPVQPGENPASFMLFSCWQNNSGTWTFAPAGLALTLAQAAASNVPTGIPAPPPNSPASATEMWDVSIPPPARNLLPNEVLQPQLMGPPLVVRTDITGPGPSAPDPIEARELNGINEVLSYLKLPGV
jgi:hypothetical protein